MDLNGGDFLYLISYLRSVVVFLNRPNGYIVFRKKSYIVYMDITVYRYM